MSGSEPRAYDWTRERLRGVAPLLMNFATGRIAQSDHQIQRGLRSSLTSIASNFLLATCKCLVGFAGHSFALFADGVESLTDVFSSGVVYLGLRVTLKPPDKDHPYGHGKAEPITRVRISFTELRDYEHILQTLDSVISTGSGELLRE